MKQKNTITVGITGQIIENTTSDQTPVAVYKILGEKRILLSEYKQQSGEYQPDHGKDAIVHRFTLRLNGQWIREGDQTYNGDVFVPN